MDKLKNYLFFNPHYHNLSKNQLIFQYKKDINNPSIIKSFQHFHEQFPHFDLTFYKNAYNELNNKNNQELSIHWINFGQYNNYISSKEAFYNYYKCFNHQFYNSHYQLNLNNEIDIIYHYLNEGCFKNYFTNESDFIHSKNQSLNKFKNDNKKKHFQININNNHDQQKLFSIAHVFVHMFKLGGGELYLYHLLNYFKYHHASIKHTLFLNKQYQNKTIISFNIPIIYYNNYDELKELLDEFDIIFDNQLYHFHLFPHYNYKTIQIIHSCSVYQKNIHSNYYYTLHLYHEKNIHESWSNIIKKILYLSVNHLSNKDMQLMNTKLNLIKNNEKLDFYNQICIVGNVNPHKFPSSFLKKLISFCNFNQNYIFNIYGDIESTYEMFFLTTIKKCKNINYHGIIEHDKIKSIYLDHFILLSPSLSEAGATVFLEAMLYGCLVIGRNAGGNQETLNYNHFYIADHDDDYFKILDHISNSDRHILLNNIKCQYYKILTYHNPLTQFNSLYHFADHLLIQKQHEQNIPNQIHYIYGLKEQTNEFPFLFFYGILSNILINKPSIIYFHYHYLPYGYWWNKIKSHLTLNYISNIDFKVNESVTIQHFAHKSDYLRLLLLEKYGGVYYDIDTICVNPHHHLLKYDIVLGIQEKYKNQDDLLGNAIIFAKKNNTFIQKWLSDYHHVFNNEKWTSASLFLPTEILNTLNNNEKENICIVDKYHFYYPNYNENYLLFQNSNLNIEDKNITYHYCNHYSKKYLDLINIQEINYFKNNSCLMSKFINNVILYQENINDQDNNHQIDICSFEQILKKKDKDSVYLLLDEHNYKNVLCSLNQIDYLFYYSINIYIVSKNLSYSLFQSFTKQCTFLKFLNIYLFQSFETLDFDNQINIIDDFNNNNIKSIFYIENNTILEKHINNFNKNSFQIYIQHIYSNN